MVLRDGVLYLSIKFPLLAPLSKWGVHILCALSCRIIFSWFYGGPDVYVTVLLITHQFINWLIYELSFLRYVDSFNFWCWSRRDYNETDLRQLPITMNFREEVFTSFTTSISYNQTSKSIKCNSHEEWAENWIDVSNQWNNVNIPCYTNVSPIATLTWIPFSKTMWVELLTLTMMRVIH